MKRLMPAALIFAAVATAAAAQDLQHEGEVLLQQNCARCHAIGQDDASPLAKAPPFRDIAKRYNPEELEEALAEGIVTGHAEMPEFQFDPDQITAIVEYLDALGNR
jgi:mono/diheme cytochrome c family protein